MGQISGDRRCDRDTTRQASQILSFRSEIRHMYVTHHDLIFKQQKKWRCNNGVVYRSQKQSNEDHRPMAAGLDRIWGHPNANLVRRADRASIELTGLDRGPMLHGRVLAKPAKRPSGSMAGS
jgi:hypothetical protein